MVANVKYALAALSISDTLSSCHNHPSPAYFLGPTKAIALHFSGFYLLLGLGSSPIGHVHALFLCLLPEAFSMRLINLFPYIHD
jgi:hypothetical protein